MIYEVRGKQVMLDFDLAKLYELKNLAKEINQSVKNNMDRFLDNFCFQLYIRRIQHFKVKIFDLKKK